MAFSLSCRELPADHGRLELHGTSLPSESGDPKRAWARHLPQGVFPPRLENPVDALPDRRDTCVAFRTACAGWMSGSCAPRLRRTMFAISSARHSRARRDAMRGTDAGRFERYNIVSAGDLRGPASVSTPRQGQFQGQSSKIGDRVESRNPKSVRQ